jgi:hypothetical protein
MATDAPSDHAPLRGLWRRRLAYAARGVAVLVLAGLLLATATRNHRGLDWSSSGRHTLSAASVAALAAVAGPIEVTAYLPKQHAGRERAQELVARYRRHRDDIGLRFVDPADAPETMREENLREGEMAIAVGTRREFIKVYSEREFTNALARLARPGEQWLAFVTGHGERSPARTANFDVSDWADVLAKRGLKAQEINLAAQGAIPDNTSLLVLASPQLEFLPGEVALIDAWVAQGGSLLWLMEPDTPASLAPLAASLGVAREAATIVDPATARLGIDNAAMAVVTTYAAADAVANFDATALLPYAAPLRALAADRWRAEPLFGTSAQAWGETGPLTGAVGQDANDLDGPLTLALALTRQAQRVVVIGDGDFLSNTYVGNGGNRDLGVRLVEWLTLNDTLIDIESKPAPDTTLELERWQIAVIAFGFLFVLPGAFVANGMLMWWKRRRA